MALLFRFLSNVDRSKFLQIKVRKILIFLKKIVDKNRRSEIDLKNSLILIEKLKQEYNNMTSEREDFFKSTLSNQQEKYENEIVAKSNQLIE